MPQVNLETGTSTSSTAKGRTFFDADNLPDDARLRSMLVDFAGGKDAVGNRLEVQSK